MMIVRVVAESFGRKGEGESDNGWRDFSNMRK
jgi:hypothetical protein